MRIRNSLLSRKKSTKNCEVLKAMQFKNFINCSVNSEPFHKIVPCEGCNELQFNLSSDSLQNCELLKALNIKILFVSESIKAFP